MSSVSPPSKLMKQGGVEKLSSLQLVAEERQSSGQFPLTLQLAKPLTETHCMVQKRLLLVNLETYM